MLKISDRAASAGISPTLAVFNKVLEKRRQGVALWDFGVGEPLSGTPAGIAEAGIEAIRRGKTKYTANAGTLEIRQGVNKYLQDQYGLNYTNEQILISNGAKQSVFNALAALVDPGDRVIVPAPYYPSYPEMIRLCCGEPIILEPGQEDLRIHAEQLKNAIDSKVKGFILNQPSNPAGISYREDELSGFADVLAYRDDLFIISDEIYSDITAPGFTYCAAARGMAELRDRIIMVSGVSKSFAMTGWRIGFAAGPEKAIRAMDRIQNQTTGHPSSISQHAAAEAFRKATFYSRELRQSLERKRKICYEALKSIKNIRIVENQGSFYFFCDMRQFLGAQPKGSKDVIQSTVHLAEWLLEENNIVTIPGEAFGMPGFLRISFTGSEENIREGIGVHLKMALAELGNL